MGANVTSLVRPRRKRGNARGWAWLGALAAALAALAVCAWLALMLNRAPDPTVPPLAAAPAEAPIVADTAPELPEADVSLDLTIRPQPRTATRRAQRAGIPLDAAANAEAPGYEILSAAELDAISQARD